jgi:preprotein translocase SecE subunit
MAGIGQYFKDTRAELRHVAWPTQSQTIIYTVLVAAISIGVAAYLGFFDFLFTTGLTNLVANLPQSNSAAVTQQPASNTAPLVQGNGLTITQGTSTTK